MIDTEIRTRGWKFGNPFKEIAGHGSADGDEDFEDLEEMASKGVPLGAETKWAGEFTEQDMVQVWSDNYEPAEAGKADVWRQVGEEVAKGAIIKMSEEEASRKCGNRLSVAALGAIPKELNSDKVRLIHDGSYSVDVNRRTRARDRMRFPLIDDAAAVMLEAKDASERHKGL